MKLSANPDDRRKEIPFRGLALFWLLTYLAVQAAMIFSYKSRHMLKTAAFWWGLPVFAAAGLLWLVFARLTLRSTWRLLRAVGRSALAELGRAKLLVVIALVLLGWMLGAAITNMVN